MNRVELLAYTPVGVRKLRKTDSQLELVGGMVKRTTHTIDLEVSVSVWEDLLTDDKFNKSWEIIKTGRSARQEAKKQADLQAKKDNLVNAVELLKTAGVINA